MDAADPQRLMLEAIAQARAGIASGQSPFGCAIALDGQVIAAAHNVVWATTDITAHAEIAALRQACAKTGLINLTGAIVATTCEPCPMCMAALHWARVDTVHYGAVIADATGAGFNELPISAPDMVRLGRSPVKLVKSPLSAECAGLFQEWLKSGSAREY